MRALHVAVCAGVLAALCAAACSSDQMKADAERAPCDTLTSELEVTPGRLIRGAGQVVRVRWVVLDELTEPVTATIEQSGPPSFRFVLPLTRDASAPQQVVYLGEAPAPFGAGAPSGPLDVILQGTLPAGCYLGAARASTSISLE